MIYTCDICNAKMVCMKENPRERCHMCEKSEQFWREQIAKEIEQTCPDIGEWGEVCSDCTEVAIFVRKARTN